MVQLNTFIDLFAGIGGFRVALEKCGLNCIFTSEIDKNCVKTYESNFLNSRVHGDITKISEEEIPTHDILCAGFPCQPFSISGKMKGFDDKRGNLFFEIIRIIEYHKPKVVFLENVKNFERHDDGKTLKKVKSALEKSGYNVYFKTLNASHYGAVTSRERIYIVGFRKDICLKNKNIKNESSFNFPEPSMEKIFLKDIININLNEPEIEIKRNDIIIKNKKRTPQLKPIQIGIINKGGQGERIYSTEGHAITFSATGGGVAAKTGAYYIDGKVRRLSVYECLKIMGFPENFVMPVSNSQAYKQIGNSVVVTVVEEIMKEIIKNVEK